MGKTIEFKSTPENWIKEATDIKRNTVRLVDFADLRFGIIREWLNSPFELNIQLVNSISGDRSTKTIKDVTYFEVGSQTIAILSW